MAWERAGESPRNVNDIKPGIQLMAHGHGSPGLMALQNICDKSLLSSPE